MSICISSRDILYTQHELIEVEWLHEIVICTERESFDLIDLLRECCQEEKWYTDTSSTEHTDKRESVDMWHHAVYNEEVILAMSDHIECHLSVISHTWGMSPCLEIEGDILSDSTIIIDDEDMHKSYKRVYIVSVRMTRI